ncbi:hypothetical protein HanRHA438_Chr11g0507481 [Helianthus annuus]|nr:hypothetical protein HanHA300_Chr11g0405791 [Helianthus annuus]KAJ0509764.1 hypothetical protein HanIR_Chr11g0532841 [Helianthus annuus]KAJ0517773.1 hypothetical protein HanHA89_Chr11g0429511 [Helianthus annuus]KAJ0685790.1 hypothetical protein HanLR1_Chr11g0407011 [Helianthus annuus]KAJ0689660.1 hypothetical protein HanOQP8_Chr11g0408591 [Helianthus annuus]
MKMQSYIKSFESAGMIPLPFTAFISSSSSCQQWRLITPTTTPLINLLPPLTSRMMYHH